jgi:hypothetical protein
LNEHALNCKLFLQSDMPRPALAEILAHAAQGRVEGNSMVGATFEINVRLNDDFDPLRLEAPDDFVYFPYFLDIEASSGQTRESHIALVTRLLECLWAERIMAAAACDFEDELPHNGGYRAGWRFRP